MVTERSDAGKSYPPLPIKDIHKEKSALPPINVQMAQMSRQLTQLIDNLQRLNSQMQISQEEKIGRLSESFNITGKTLDDYNYSNQKFPLSEIQLKRFEKKRKFSNSAFVFFLVIGIAAAVFSAIVLFFHGPTMI